MRTYPLQAGPLLQPLPRPLRNDPRPIPAPPTLKHSRNLATRPSPLSSISATSLHSTCTGVVHHGEEGYGGGATSPASPWSAGARTQRDRSALQGATAAKPALAERWRTRQHFTRRSPQKPSGTFQTPTSFTLVLPLALARPSCDSYNSYNYHVPA